jgi:hypothetical protein
VAGGWNKACYFLRREQRVNLRLERLKRLRALDRSGFSSATRPGLSCARNQGAGQVFDCTARGAQTHRRSASSRQRVLVYLGNHLLKTEDGIEVWPLGRLLTALAGDTLWP